MTDEKIDQLRRQVEELSAAVHENTRTMISLTGTISALYEQQRVRTWEQGLGMPATAPYVPEPGKGPPEKPAVTPSPAKPDAYAPVKASILAYSAKHGQKAALDVLARFGAKSGLQLKPDQYDKAFEAFKL